MEAEHLDWADPLAHLLRAAVARGEGDLARSVKHLSAATAGFVRAGMALYAGAARRRLGAALGGPEGEHLVTEADLWMNGQGIRKPELMARMLAPGL